MSEDLFTQKLENFKKLINSIEHKDMVLLTSYMNMDVKSVRDYFIALRENQCTADKFLEIIGKYTDLKSLPEEILKKISLYIECLIEIS